METIDLLTEEIAEHMVPVIKDYLLDVYETPEKFLDPTQGTTNSKLMKFQFALKKVPNWTHAQIKEQLDAITSRCSWFKDLMVGLFVAYINKLASNLRTNASSGKLNIKLPSDETFIHTCFVRCSADLYEDPYVMSESEPGRTKKLDERITRDILKSIKKLIPIKAILDSRIPPMSDSMAFGGNEPDTPMPLPVSAPVDEPPPEPEPEPEPAHVPEPMEPEPELREIPAKPDLFPDAPEEKNNNAIEQDA
jgi:hypothetical protein